jgi:hypothetical protein
LRNLPCRIICASFNSDAGEGRQLVQAKGNTGSAITAISLSNDGL